MKKIETIWHYLLYQAIVTQQFQHTQAGLATLFHFSTSTINLALVKPTAIGAIRKSSKFFVVADPIKLLYLTATVRNLPQDIVYQTTSIQSIHELEGIAPKRAIYGGYSAATEILGESPADYSTLYLYCDPADLGEIKSRYPMLKSGPTAIIILKSPLYLPLPHHTSLPHTFVDIWQTPGWQYKDFCDELEKAIVLKLRQKS